MGSAAGNLVHFGPFYLDMLCSRMDLAASATGTSWRTSISVLTLLSNLDFENFNVQSISTQAHLPELWNPPKANLMKAQVYSVGAPPFDKVG